MAKEENSTEVQEYLATPELTGFTKLVEDLIMQMNAVKLKEVKGVVNSYRDRIETLINTTLSNEIVTAMNNIRQAIINKGGAVITSNPTWDEIIYAINSIPSEHFTKPKSPEIKTYGIPEAQVSWGDNIADAYRTAKEFQEMIDDNDGIHGPGGERIYKGFYMIEYAPSMIPYGSTKTKKLIFTTTVDKDDTKCNGNGFLVGLKERRFLEFSDYELSQGIVTKSFEFSLEDIPENGKLYIFFLFEKDEYRATTPVNDSTKGSFGEGKCLIIGGHPYSLTCPSGTKFDEGIIQLNRTGEQVDTTIPSAIAGNDGKGGGYDGAFICIEDYQHEEEQLSFTGNVYYRDGEPMVHYENEPFVDDPCTHFEYIAFPYGERTHFENFKVEDRYKTIIESRFVEGQEVPLDSYKLIIDNDGYSLLDPSGNFKIYDHPGTNFNINNNVDANAIYLRQARGVFTAHNSAYIDKMHLPELVEHGLAADGATTDSTYIANSNSDLYELELPALEKVTAGGVVNLCPKLHELVLPKLEENKGTIAIDCSSLYRLSLPNLKTSSGTIASGCPKLSVLELPVIHTISCDKTVFNNISVPKLDLSSVTAGLVNSSAQGYQCTIYNVSSYEIDLRNCPSFRLNIQFAKIIADCPNLEILHLESLKTITTYSTGSMAGYICGLPNLKTLYLSNPPSLDKGGGGDGRYCLQDSPNLIKIVVGCNEECEVPLHLSKYIPFNAFLTNSSDLVEDSTICANNLEQFLYNFREYIVRRLAVTSQKTYIYLHATTKSYILGEDESHYAENWKVPGESDFYTDTLNDELAARNWGIA